MSNRYLPPLILILFLLNCIASSACHSTLFPAQQHGSQQIYRLTRHAAVRRSLEYSECCTVRGKSSTVQYLRPLLVLPALCRTSSHVLTDSLYEYSLRHTVRTRPYVTLRPSTRYELHQGYEYGEHSEYRSVRGESSTVQYLRLFPALYRTRTSSHAQIDFFYPQRHTVQKWLYVTSRPNPRCQLHASATRTSRILINTPKPDRCHGLNRVKANAKNKPLSEAPGVKHQTLPEYRIATTQQSVLPARYGKQYEYPILNPEFRNE